MKVATRIWLLALVWAGGIPLNFAAAQVEPGIYAGFSFGSTDSKGSNADFSQQAQSVYNSFGIATGTRTAAPLDTEDSGYGFTVGYRFNSYLALEAGYVDLGKTKYRESAPGVFLADPSNTVDTFNVKLSSSIAGLTVSALGIYPLSYRWEAYGRAGLIIDNDKVDVSIANSTDRASFNVSQSATDVMVGVGVSYSLVEIYSVRAEFLRVLDAGDKISGENDIDMLSIGLTVRF